LVRKPSYALSLKQPWAALLVSGHKSIEVRKWATRIRGPVFIHAARISDDRSEVWAKVPEAVRPLAELVGGIIGRAELASCIRYRTQFGFAADSAKHLNAPSWFELPEMYGFMFRGGKAVPFFPCKGNVRFFTVNIPEGT
jgi:hypothetical protein